MESFHSSSNSNSNSNSNSRRWKKRVLVPYHQNYATPLFILISFIIIALFISYTTTLLSSPPLLLSISLQPSQCGGEKFLWYAPHSGFSNQLSEFKNALLMASILNRTLVVPPILDHHAVALGSCPKFRVLNPNDLRFKLWNHTVHLIRHRRYISMADVIDLSSLVTTSPVRRLIDFRDFISMWCGVDIHLACNMDSDLTSSSSLLHNLQDCGSALSGYDHSVGKCIYASQQDCRTTVWTYKKENEDGVLDSFQADDELKNKRKVPFVRTRKDVYKALGPDSAAGRATILAFGSLFTAPYKGSESYIDIHEAPNDQRIQLLIQKIEFLPFVPEILDAGKKFALQTIKAPFLCAQLRLLDGQFKNHWETTFLVMKQKLELLKQQASLPVHIFVMTDLPQGNWTGSYLGDLAKDSNAFRLFSLREDDELVVQTAAKLVDTRHSMKLQSVSRNFDGKKHQCKALVQTDVLLYVEESICSCASLGFVGTAGSTIAESIELMRKNGICLK